MVRKLLIYIVNKTISYTLVIACVYVLDTCWQFEQVDFSRILNYKRTTHMAISK